MIPYTPAERLALLDEIESGDKIVLPVNYEHAVAMLNVASHYIREQHQATWTALTKEY